MAVSRQLHRLQPLVFAAKEAHKNGWVQYQQDGNVRVTHPEIDQIVGKKEVVIEPDHQFPLVFSTLADLAKALSSSANSPMIDGLSLREHFDREFDEYRQLTEVAQAEGVWEPDYGSYVFDSVTGNLFLVAPERWHRTALVTSTGMLLTDKEQKMSWYEVRQLLESKVIGFVGASVGGNLIEGVARELRPKCAKVADPDWIETNNLNRLERGTLTFLSQSRSARSDLMNSYELGRWSKAEVAAYCQQLVDPYSQWYVYQEGITEENIDRFLLGDKKGEPGLDMVIEEADDLPLKVLIRKRCRELGIPVLMLSDFGHCAYAQFWDFAHNPQRSLGYQCSDLEIDTAVDKAMTSGNREDVFALFELMCGTEFARDEFKAWVKGTGEQPTSSLPQSGATAMISGGIGGKWAARYFLGHQIPEYRVFDFVASQVYEQ
ncbi:hypothetical protein KBC79_01015 [Candidatus Woesebacteria bacterium]|nr:hypothetical protein [Candidatus Woesebacteria bacterium]